MNHMQIAERIFNQPLMMSEARLNGLLNVFSQKSGYGLLGLQQLGPAPVPGTEMLEVSDTERRRAGYQVIGGVAVINVSGLLLHMSLDGWYPSWITTYADIRHAIDLAMADDAVKHVVGLFGTGGGEVSGVFDLADHIFSLRGTKPLTAVVDEEAFSSGYLLASSFDRVITPRTGGVGSIGVIATHTEFSKWEEETGITVKHIYAGARKADFSQHQPLSSEAESALQVMVDDTYQLFGETVARNLGITKQAVFETEAGIYVGKKAVKAKLAHEVCAVDKAILKARKGKGFSLFSATAQPQATGKENKVKTVEELKEKCPDLVAQVETAARQGMIAQADATAVQTEAVTAESTRIMALVTAVVGEDAGARISAVAAKGLTTEDMAAMGVDLAANAGGQTQQQMLDAITLAASKGVKTGVVETSAEKVGIDTAAIYANRQKAIAG